MIRGFKYWILRLRYRRRTVQITLEQADYVRAGETITLVEFDNSGEIASHGGWDLHTAIRREQRLLCMGKRRFLPIRSGDDVMRIEGAFNIMDLLI